MIKNPQTNDQPVRRVVITGMGVVAPNGCDLASFWQSIVKGESAAAPVTRFDTKGMPTRVGCEIKDFKAKNYMDAKMAHRVELSIQYGLAASRMAAEDAGIDFEKLDPDRTGVVEGTSLSGTESSLKCQTTYETKGYMQLSPFTLINAHSGGGSGEISVALGIKGHAVSYSTSSASGNDAIGYAFRMIRDDELDVVVAGGAESPLLAPIWGVFCRTKVMTQRNEEPQGAMRPLDKTRDGFLLGEGSGFVILEELSHALSRGAKIYAEIAGHGRSCEAYHSVSPHPEGIGARRSMEKALRMAQLRTSEINYINIHGTATASSDLVEMKAIKQLFNGHTMKVAVSATKPVTGHLLAAAGAIETIVCALSIRHSQIPYTLNLKNPEEDFEGDLVMDHSRAYPVRNVINLNSGFGGKNSCLVLKEYPGPS